MLYVDGLATNVGSGARLIVVSLEGHLYEHALKCMFKTSNNEVDYEALLAVMKIYNTLGAECPKAFFYFQLVVSQVSGEYEARDLSFVTYLSKVKKKFSMFKKFEIEYLPRSENRQANALSKLSSSFRIDI